MTNSERPALAFDVYGTLVDPLEMDHHLRPFAGEDASGISALWRQKQLEYTFRRGLMRDYRDFGVCTRQALEYAARAHGLKLSDDDMDGLVAEYQNLRAFPDVAPALRDLRERGYGRIAFSNGVEKTAATLLTNAGVMELMDGIVSVDDVSTFKPDPEVYGHLASRLGRAPEEVWVVSSNPFDVIGAKNSGMNSAWVQRNPDIPFDPWNVEPDVIVPDLEHLAERIEERIAERPS